MFQANLDSAQDEHLYQGRRASLPLDIVIIGCGLGGLSSAYCLAQAGHKVTILESAPAIADVGAGIQASPNVSRLLIRWGLRERLDELGVKPQNISIRRCELCLECVFRYLLNSLSPGENDEVVGWTAFGDTMLKEYGAPYYHIHVKSVSLM